MATSSVAFAAIGAVPDGVLHNLRREVGGTAVRANDIFQSAPCPTVTRLFDAQRPAPVMGVRNPGLAAQCEYLRKVDYQKVFVCHQQLSKKVLNISEKLDLFSRWPQLSSNSHSRPFLGDFSFSDRLNPSQLNSDHSTLSETRTKQLSNPQEPGYFPSKALLCAQAI